MRRLAVLRLVGALCLAVATPAVCSEEDAPLRIQNRRYEVSVASESHTAEGDEIGLQVLDHRSGRRTTSTLRTMPFEKPERLEWVGAERFAVVTDLGIFGGRRLHVRGMSGVEIVTVEAATFQVSPSGEAIVYESRSPKFGSPEQRSSEVAVLLFGSRGVESSAVPLQGAELRQGSEIHVTSPFLWSPDGRRFGFVVSRSGGGAMESAVVTVCLGGSGVGAVETFVNLIRPAEWVRPGSEHRYDLARFDKDGYPFGLSRVWWSGDGAIVGTPHGDLYAAEIRIPVSTCRGAAR